MKMLLFLEIRVEGLRKQGRSDGGEGVYRYLYPRKSAQVNFLWGKNDVRMAIQQFYTPPPKKNFYTPKTNVFVPGNWS